MYSTVYGKYIIMYINLKVKHSQSMSKPPLKPWAGIRPDGTIICAHCNCMAGAGEACSHIAAMLYVVMAGVRMREETSCTSTLCRWLEPATTKQV